MIHRFLQIPYVEQGRNYSGADCWGIVVLWMREKHNLDLPEYGSVVTKGMQDCFQSEHVKFINKFAEGSIACVFTRAAGKEVFTHVGIVAHDKILHTSITRGPRLDEKRKFDRLGKVEYYYDKRL